MSRITLSERTAIEAGIYARKPLSEIVKKIGKTTTAVSRELRKNSTHVSGVHPHGNDCRMATNCKRLCGDKKYERNCVHCKTIDCVTICRQCNNSPCKQLINPPYHLSNSKKECTK